MSYLKTTNSPWQKLHFVRIAGYTFLAFLAQIYWVSRLPYPALRVDLLLPLMFGVAVEWPPILSLLWACAWGYVADVLSGKFWGLHVGSYVVAICLVNITIEKFEFHNPVYQMCFVGLCALGQSLTLGLYLLFDPAVTMDAASTWTGLLMRSLLTMAASPLLIYPMWSVRGERP